jgi:hypothetical protein
MNNESDNHRGYSKANIIQSVKTPIGLFALVLLLVEGILGVLAYTSQGDERSYLIRSMVFALFLIVVIVTLLSVFRPEALSGGRPQKTLFVDMPKEEIQPKKQDDGEMDDLPKIRGGVLADPKLANQVPSLATKFRLVDIPEYEPPRYLQFPLSPVGLFMIQKIPFYLKPAIDKTGRVLGHCVVDVQPDYYNVARTAVIDALVEDVSKIHFLIAAGHGWSEHEGIQFLQRRIGYIELMMTGGAIQSEDLILGRNVREWAFGNAQELVRVIDESYASPAWVSYNNHYRIDTISLSVRDGPKGLSRIKVVAQFEIGINKKIRTPAIIISAITCEHPWP